MNVCNNVYCKGNGNKIDKNGSGVSTLYEKKHKNVFTGIGADIVIMGARRKLDNIASLCLHQLL